MAFIASTQTLNDGFARILNVAVQAKSHLARWNTDLASAVTSRYVLDMKASLDQSVPLLDQYAALPGMAAYAQAQFGSPAYDIVAEYDAMRTALVAINAWIVTNLPANAVSVVNGVVTPVTYQPASTAPLKALVATAITKIA